MFINIVFVNINPRDTSKIDLKKVERAPTNVAVNPQLMISPNKPSKDASFNLKTIFS